MAQGSEKKLKILINCAYLALIAVIAFFTVKYLIVWIMPFIIGFILAAAVQPFVRYLSGKRNINVKACSVAAVLILIFLLLIIISFLLFKFLNWAGSCTQNIPSVINGLNAYLKQISVNISPMMTKIEKCTGVKCDTSLSGISHQIFKLSRLSDTFGKMVHNAVYSLPSFFFNFIITIISACFFAADFKGVVRFAEGCLPERRRKSAAGIKDFFLNTILKFILAYFKLMCITFAELLAGLLLLRVQNALPAAAAIALIDILPVLGVGTVMIPWAVIEFISGKLYFGAGLIILYAIITVVRNILEPRIVGKHIGLHPLITLFSMVIGLKAMGIAGMIILPITVLFIRQLYKNGIIKLWKRG